MQNQIDNLPKQQLTVLNGIAYYKCQSHRTYSITDKGANLVTNGPGLLLSQLNDLNILESIDRRVVFDVWSGEYFVKP